MVVYTILSKMHGHTNIKFVIKLRQRNVGDCSVSEYGGEEKNLYRV